MSLYHIKLIRVLTIELPAVITLKIPLNQQLCVMWWQEFAYVVGPSSTLAIFFMNADKNTHKNSSVNN